MPVKRKGTSNGLRARLENAQNRAALQSGMVVAQRAQGYAPVDKGRLKRSITQGEPEVVGPMKVRIDVGTNVEYAAIQEFGGEIPPHEIKAVNKKALSFDWPAAPDGSGKGVFKSVQHPGATIPAHPYLRPALKDSKDIIKGIHIRNIVAALKSS